MNPSGAEFAMPTFNSLEALEEYRALGITVSMIESLPVEDLRKVATRVSENLDEDSREEELEKNLTALALRLYNDHSPKFKELEKCVDDVSRERLANR